MNKKKEDNDDYGAQFIFDSMYQKYIKKKKENDENNSHFFKKNILS